MKLLKLLILTILSITIVAGCSGNNIGDKTNDFETVGKLEAFSENKRVLKDRKTGCMYLESTYSLTPYYDEDGQVMGCNNINKN